MNKQEQQEFITLQDNLIKPQIEAAVDEMMQELEYAPPPPNPFHPMVSEKEARKNLKEDMMQLLMSQNPSERILMGFELIFEHLHEVPNGIEAKEELKEAGNKFSEEMFNPDLSEGKTLDDYAISFISEASDAHANNKPFSVDWGLSFDTYQTIYQLANLFFEREKFKEASLIYEVLNLIDGNCHEAWFGAGLCHYQIKNWREAAANFSMAVATDATNILSMTNLAQCYLKLQERDKAIEMIDLADGVISGSEEDSNFKTMLVLALKDLRKEAA